MSAVPWSAIRLHQQQGLDCQWYWFSHDDGMSEGSTEMGQSLRIPSRWWWCPHCVWIAETLWSHWIGLPPFVLTWTRFLSSEKHLWMLCMLSKTSRKLLPRRFWSATSLQCQREDSQRSSGCNLCEICPKKLRCYNIFHRLQTDKRRVNWKCVNALMAYARETKGEMMILQF